MIQGERKKSSTVGAETPSPVSLRMQLDEILERFTAAWKNHERPAIENYIPDIMRTGVRLAALWELIHADFIFRCQANEEPDPAEYSRRFSNLASEVDLVQSLVDWRACRARLQAMHPETWQPGDETSFPGSIPLAPSLPTLALRKIESSVEAGLGEPATAELVPPVGTGYSALSTKPHLDPVVQFEAPRKLVPTSQPANSLGRFEVLRLHARGGLGIVSVALDRELNREVAIKQLRPEWADDLNLSLIHI